MCDKEEFKRKFVLVLRESEDRLSDGFKYYQNYSDDVDKCLEEIAEKLWKSVQGD